MPQRVLGSRHATRERILRIVQTSPGINRSQLTDALGAPWGTVGHHLFMLTRARRIVAVRCGRELLLFPHTVLAQHYRALYALRQPDSHEMVDALRAAGPLRLGQVAHLTGRSRKVVARRLRSLQAAGLVDRQDGLRGAYFLAQAMHLPLEPEGLDRLDIPLAQSGDLDLRR